MLRLVLDTNILISATIEQAGASSKILNAWKQDQVTLITSPVLISEFKEVLKRPRIRKYQWMSPEEVDSLVDLLTKAATQTSGELLVSVVKADPDDDYVLSAALEGAADFIVTGNIHLLELHPFQGIQILTPAEMLRVLEKSKPRKN